MRPQPTIPVFIALMAAVVVAVLAVADHAQAQTPGGQFRGDSYVAVDSGTGTRHFAWRVVNDQNVGALDRNDALWKVDADQDWTLYWQMWTTGILPPGAPSSVVLQVCPIGEVSPFDDCFTHSAGGAAPANGDQATFGTIDFPGGTLDAGTYDVIVNAVLGGINGYNACTPVTSAFCTSNPNDADVSEQGILQAKMRVSSSTVSGFSAGSTFAFGPTADAVAQVDTVGYKAPVQDGYDFVTVWERTDGTVIETDTETDWPLAGTDTQTSSIDSSYGTAPGTYRVRYEIGNHPDLGIPWSEFSVSGHAANLATDGLDLVSTSTFTVDRSVAIDGDGTGAADGTVVRDHSVYNRGESVTFTFYVLNVVGEQVTRSATVSVHAENLNVENSAAASPTAGQYSRTYTVLATHQATNDVTGSPKDVRVTYGDVMYQAGDQFSVSSLYFVDAHPQLGSTLVKDDWPMQDNSEDPSYIISADVVHEWCHVRNVRLDAEIDTSGNAVTIQMLDPSDASQQSINTDTGSDGWTPTSGAHKFTATPPAGFWAMTCDVSFGGNSGQDAEDLAFVSAFTGDLEVLILLDHEPESGEVFTLLVETGQRGQAKVPNDVPKFTLAVVDGSGIAIDRQVTDADMVNVVDWSATVNGALYAYNLTWPTDVQVGNLYVAAIINAAYVSENMLVHTAAVAETTSNDGVAFQQDESDPFRQGNALRVCVGSSLAGQNMTFQAPDGSTANATIDSDGCAPVLVADHGAWSASWTDGAIMSTAAFNVRAAPAPVDWAFWVTVAVATFLVIMGLWRGWPLLALFASLAVFVPLVPSFIPYSLDFPTLGIVLALWLYYWAAQARRRGKPLEATKHGS